MTSGLTPQRLAAGRTQRQLVQSACPSAKWSCPPVALDPSRCLQRCPWRVPFPLAEELIVCGIGQR